VEVDGPPSQGSVETTYMWGDEVTLTAVPDADDGWFTGWRGDVPHSTQNETVTIPMNGHREVTATFQTHVVEVDVDHGGDENEVNALELYRDGDLVDSVEAYEAEGYVDLPHAFDVDPVDEGEDVEYFVRAYAMDIAAAGTSVEVGSPGSPARVELDAEPYVTRTYEVTDDGDPIEGATVEIRTHEDDPDQLWRAVETDGNGKVAVPLQPVDPDLTVVDDQWFEVTVDVDGDEVFSEEIDVSADNLEDTVEVVLS